ncbi:hypothetical protein RBB79_01855 [Tunturiibacter empetritectus]|uniref:Uncharacterized protein n=2 Tax=Tunturiibacter TaxID=3154218 RepID=A0A852V9Z9_9BACT|nr:hypothetical protein [Edaphobacter lichenicola]NYF88237.1 hypothetical protein [Edaphobacter lichenicola]
MASSIAILEQRQIRGSFTSFRMTIVRFDGLMLRRGKHDTKQIPPLRCGMTTKKSKDKAKERKRLKESKARDDARAFFVSMMVTD